MPDNEVLKSVAADIANINIMIRNAEELIAALREAGETVTDQEAALRTLKIRKEKWERMLQARGYPTGS